MRYAVLYSIIFSIPMYSGTIQINNYLYEFPYSSYAPDSKIGLSGTPFMYLTHGFEQESDTIIDLEPPIQFHNADQPGIDSDCFNTLFHIIVSNQRSITSKSFELIEKLNKQKLFKEHLDYFGLQTNSSTLTKPLTTWSYSQNNIHHIKLDHVTLSMIPLKQSVDRTIFFGQYLVTKSIYYFIMQKEIDFPDSEKDYPIRDLNFNQVTHFLTKLNEKLIDNEYQDGFRLPTFEEWEFAAVSGEHNSLPWEDEPQTIFQYADLRFPYFEKPVGHKKPNGIEIYDCFNLLGEWTQKKENTIKIVSFLETPRCLFHLKTRNQINTIDRYPQIGLRLVRELRFH